MAKGTPTLPLFPVGSVGSTPPSPSSTESGSFSVPSVHTSHRDSVSTTSTAFSATEATSEFGDQKPCSTCGCSGPIRPQLFQPTKTTTAVPATSSITRPHSTEPTSTIATPHPPGNGKPVKHDPLSRNFPKSSCDATIEEMLARDPGKWSLNHWIKKEAEVRQRQPTTADKEAAARRFAETKAALLKSHQEMGLLTLGRGRGIRGSGSGRARTD